MEGPIALDPLILIKKIPKDHGPLGFGIIVKRKLGPAVIRNLIKRRIRNALYTLAHTGQDLAQKNLDCLIIVRKNSVATYQFDELCSILKRLITN